MTREIADRLLEFLRLMRHLLARTLADIPIGGPEYRQIDHVVQEIDGLAKVLIGGRNSLLPRRLFRSGTGCMPSRQSLRWLQRSVRYGGYHLPPE